MSAPVGQPYPEWLAVAGISSRCRDGATIFDEMSRQDPRYDPQETRTKFDEAYNKMKPPTCGYIQNSLASTACSSCAVRHVVRSPMAFARSEPLEAELQSEFVIDASTQRFASVRSGRIYTEQAFRNRFGHHAAKGSITTNLIRDKWTGRVEQIVYRPGEADALIREGGGWVLNTWKDTGVRPVQGDCAVILDHLRLMVPDDLERDHLLDYLAFHLQNLGVKIPHGILLQGRQGTGKSYLRALLTNLLGRENCATVEPDALDQVWTAAWSNKQLLTIEEMMSQKRLEAYNRLKTWLSEETTSVNEKHVPIYVAATPRIILVLTNHPLATVIPPDDRRFFVLASEMERQPPAYYERLWSAGLAQAAAFKAFLLSRDVSGFKHGAPPPITLGKTLMIEDSTPPLERRLSDLIAEGGFPFHRALLRFEEIRAAFSGGRGEPVREAALRAALRAVGAKRRDGQIIMPDGTKPRFWAVRDAERWVHCSAEEARQEALKPFDPRMA
jgi:hypothetical protein